MDNGATLSTKVFAETARDFCNWCEQPIETETRNTGAASWLCKLYAQALSLCRTDAENDGDPPEIPATDLVQATQRLSVFNGWYYRENFDPDPTLTDESSLGDVGDEMKEALWYWEFLFRAHWERHAVGAIFALHCMALSKAE